jgi:hypothetical protein
MNYYQPREIIRDKNLAAYIIIHAAMMIKYGQSGCVLKIVLDTLRQKKQENIGENT